MNIINYKHYVLLGPSGNIVDGFSTGPRPNFDKDNSVCINEQGSYQFRLFSDGEENPNLFTEDMIPLYKWDGEKVVSRTEEEIEADRAEMIANQPAPKPTEMEKLRADLDYVMLMNGLDVDPN